MYFDELRYLDKDRQSTMPENQVSGSKNGAQNADPILSTASSPQQPAAQAQEQEQVHTQPSSASSSMPKSQTVGAAAGDLHSMALKSAINNIGTITLNIQSSLLTVCK